MENDPMLVIGVLTLAAISFPDLSSMVTTVGAAITFASALKSDALAVFIGPKY